MHPSTPKSRREESSSDACRCRLQRPRCRRCKASLCRSHLGWIRRGSRTSPAAALSQANGVVVTINYRLGIFGFLAHPSLTTESAQHASGDHGLLDQILALKWVHENIAKFGGDPDNVTVFSQSAGAIDAGMLMTSPLARDLFQKVIAESRTALAPPLTTLATAEQNGIKVTALVDPEAKNTSSVAAIAGVGKIRVVGQDLAGDRVFDITRDVRIQGRSLHVPGDIIRQVGLNAATPGDVSSPGLVIAFG